jgi:hypothetical protein
VIRSDTALDDPGRLTPVRLLGRLRFSLLLGAVVVALQLLPGGATANANAVRWLGINWHTFASGQIWRLVTDVLIQGRPGLRWSILIPFLWVGVAEWHIGWRLTAIAYFVTDWLSTVPTLIVLRLASTHSQWSAQQIARFDSGSSAAIYGTLATFCASRRGPNAWIGPVLLVQTMVTIWLTNRRLFDVQHLVSIGVGLLLGFFAARAPTRPKGR